MKIGTFVCVGKPLGCLLSCFLALGAYADGYVTLMAKNSTTTGFAGATWSEDIADEDKPNYDYLAAGGYVFYTAQSEVINARSLTLGIVGGTACNFYDYYSSTFNNEGIIFANGEAHLNASASTLAGKATFTSPASAPFRFYGATKNDNRGFTFPGDVHSASTAGILVYADSHTGFYFTFSGDTSDYLGSVVVTSKYDSAGAPLGASLRLSGSASYFGGSIVMRDGTTFNPQIATSVGSLTLDEGSSLSLVAGNTLTVRTALTVNGGPVPLLAPAAVGEVTQYALVTMPVGSACTEADFVVTNYSDYTTMPRLYMVTSGETKTLYGEYYPKITITKSNESEEVSAVTDGAYWSDGLPVHGSAHYKVAKTGKTSMHLSTPYDFETPLVFAGMSLDFDASCMLHLYAGDYTISNVLFRGGSNNNMIYGAQGSNVTLRGSFYIGGNTALRLVTRLSGSIRLSGPCTGEPSSVISVFGASASTSAIREIVVLEGDHSGYPGKYLVTVEYPSQIRFADRFLSLRVSDAASLGGPRPEFAYDALKIEHAGRLEAYGSFTLDEPTRGVFISGQGRFYVKTNETLTVKEQLTVNGRAYKEGPGALALGGALRFLGSEGELTETPPEDATNRTFYVMGGRIKPLSAHSLDGLDVVFSNKTSKLAVGIAMDIEPGDAELLAKGMCNAKSENPFSVQSDNADEKINIALECANPVKGKVYEFAVMTLTNTVADAVFDRLSFTRPEGFSNYKLNLERVSDAEAGTKTLRATLKEHGLVLSVR